MPFGASSHLGGRALGRLQGAPLAAYSKPCTLHGIFTSSHLLPLEPESSKAVTLKSAFLGALHAVDSSCSPSAQAHLQRLLKQQAPHCPQLW